jgi:hypothetical protein
MAGQRVRNERVAAVVDGEAAEALSAEYFARRAEALAERMAGEQPGSAECGARSGERLATVDSTRSAFRDPRSACQAETSASVPASHHSGTVLVRPHPAFFDQIVQHRHRCVVAPSPQFGYGSPNVFRVIVRQERSTGTSHTPLDPT